MLSVNTINKYIFSRPDVLTALSIPGRTLTDFSTDIVFPVHPINEQPESDAPYIIYSWKTFRENPNWFISCDEITYWVWDIDIKRMMNIQALLMKYLGKIDESAEDIRLWMAQEGIGGVIDIKSSTYIGSAEWFTQSQEGGVVGQGLTFKITYIDCEV